MKLHVTNQHVTLKNRRPSGLFTITIVRIVILMASLGLSCKPKTPAGGTGSEAASNPPSDQTALKQVRASEISPSVDVNNATGPVVMLNYDPRTAQKNPISSFMYFIPLLSPTLVDKETSADDEQQVGIVSYERNITSKSFHVSCEFKITGTGFHKNTFDPAGMTAEHAVELGKGKSLTNILDYIKFEGGGFGCIEVKGKITGPTETVTDVALHFNARDQKSPVTIGLYDIKPKDGQYKYENRSDETVARVNTFTFKNSEPPEMGIEIASLHRKMSDESYWDTVKAAMANFFINPPKVTKLGNDTMLRFGYALLKQKPEFTFPLAKNLTENKKLVTDNKQNQNAAVN